MLGGSTAADDRWLMSAYFGWCEQRGLDPVRGEVAADWVDERFQTWLSPPTIRNLPAKLSGAWRRRVGVVPDPFAVGSRAAAVLQALARRRAEQGYRLRPAAHAAAGAVAAMLAEPPPPRALLADWIQLVLGAGVEAQLTVAQVLRSEVELTGGGLDVTTATGRQVRVHDPTVLAAAKRLAAGKVGVWSIEAGGLAAALPRRSAARDHRYAAEMVARLVRQAVGVELLPRIVVGTQLHSELIDRVVMVSDHARIVHLRDTATIALVFCGGVRPITVARARRGHLRHRTDGGWTLPIYVAKVPTALLQTACVLPNGRFDAVAVDPARHLGVWYEVLPDVATVPLLPQLTADGRVNFAAAYEPDSANRAITALLRRRAELAGVTSLVDGDTEAGRRRELTSYSGRRTFARLADEAGVPLVHLMYGLNHQGLTHTIGYARSGRGDASTQLLAVELDMDRQL